MAAQLPMQDYIYASEIAYKNNPIGLIASFLPQYKLVEEQTLGDGFQCMVLQAKAQDAHYLFAFRGTLPDYQGTINHFSAYYNDEMMLANNTLPSAAQLKQYEADYGAWKGDPMIQDLNADSEIFSGKYVEQFRSALNLVSQYMARSRGQNFYVTGHSLGGGIADYVAGHLAGINGTTFAAPGYQGYGQLSVATMKNYYNVNDTIPAVNLKFHCGACIPLDILHSSFAVEHQLRLRSDVIYGFNGTPDVTTALTAQGDKVMAIAASSLGFLVARLIYHNLANYAGLLNCKSITGHTTKYTLQDFANASRYYISNLMFLRRQNNDPIHGMSTFSIRVIKRGEQMFLSVVDAYCRAEVEMGSYGYGMAP